jgi:chorismate dehydratase
LVLIKQGIDPSQDITMNKIIISAVRYANTYPFIWGLKESGFEKKVILETDHPADCAAKLIDGRADIGLIPVAALPLINNPDIIGDYCIGANGKVRTVMLLSNCPFSEIQAINLDYRSESSVNLVKVLARHMWIREFRWIDTSEHFDFENIGKNEGAVLIGDQCFAYEKKFLFQIDLAEEWKKQTGMPFVFACWTANRPVGNKFIRDFNAALRYGVENIDKVAKSFGNSSVIGENELRDYLSNNIDYIFDSEKKRGMMLFLNLLKKT